MPKMCKNCGSLMDDNFSNCTNCGAPLEVAAAPAPGAPVPPQGAPVPPQGQVPPQGAPVPPQQPYPGQPAYQQYPGQPMYQDPTLKSKVLAGILGLVFGGFGVHNFYLGYTSKAVIQIVVTFVTCGIGSLWGFIEGIMILCGSIKTDAQGRPLRD